MTLTISNPEYPNEEVYPRVIKIEDNDLNASICGNITSFGRMDGLYDSGSCGSVNVTPLGPLYAVEIDLTASWSGAIYLGPPSSPTYTWWRRTNDGSGYTAWSVVGSGSNYTFLADEDVTGITNTYQYKCTVDIGSLSHTSSVHTIVIDDYKGGVPPDDGDDDPVVHFNVNICGNLDEISRGTGSYDTGNTCNPNPGVTALFNAGFYYANVNLGLEITNDDCQTSGNLSYDWERRYSTSGPWTNVGTGASYSFNTPTDDVTGSQFIYYRCIVQNACGLYATSSTYAVEITD